MSTFNTKKLDPMLVCPDWCDLTEHDRVERLDRLTHWRDILTLEDLRHADPHPDDDPSTRLYVDVYRDGYGADTMVRMGVGSQIGSSALLTIEQATEVIRAMQDAIAIVERATT